MNIPQKLKPYLEYPCLVVGCLLLVWGGLGMFVASPDYYKGFLAVIFIEMLAIAFLLLTFLAASLRLRRWIFVLCLLALVPLLDGLLFIFLHVRII